MSSNYVYPRNQGMAKRLKEPPDRDKTIRASGILNNWRSNLGAFMDIDNIANQLQSVNNWEDMVTWASECGLTGVDINLLCEEYRNKYTLFFNVWRVAANVIEVGSKNRQEVIEWFRQYSKEVNKPVVKKSPEEMIKELGDLI